MGDRGPIPEPLEDVKMLEMKLPGVAMDSKIFRTQAEFTTAYDLHQLAKVG